MTNKTSSHLVDKHFISRNNYKSLKASRYLERIPALTTEIHADFNMWTFKGYGHARGHDGKKSEVDVVPYRM